MVEPFVWYRVVEDEEETSVSYLVTWRGQEVHPQSSRGKHDASMAF